MRRVVLLLLPLLVPLLVLAGCATGPSLQTRMTAYIGTPVQTLVQTLGVPDKQITVNGVDYLAYVQSQAQLVPNAAAFGFGWGSPFGPGAALLASTPQNIQVWSCETIFAVKDGKVWDVTFKGNNCN